MVTIKTDNLTESELNLEATIDNNTSGLPVISGTGDWLKSKVEEAIGTWENPDEIEITVTLRNV